MLPIYIKATFRWTQSEMKMKKCCFVLTCDSAFGRAVWDGICMQTDTCVCVFESD